MIFIGIASPVLLPHHCLWFDHLHANNLLIETLFPMSVVYSGLLHVSLYSLPTIGSLNKMF